MDYTTLGKSGIEVSRICLGCMGFGKTADSPSGAWTLEETPSREIISRALELGVNFRHVLWIYLLGRISRKHAFFLGGYSDTDIFHGNAD